MPTSKSPDQHKVLNGNLFISTREIKYNYSDNRILKGKNFYSPHSVQKLIFRIELKQKSDLKPNLHNPVSIVNNDL